MNTTTNEMHEVPATIAAQAFRLVPFFRACVKSAVYDETSIKFMLKNKRHVIVALDPTDTYSITVGTIRNCEWVELASHSFVYASDMGHILRDAAGL